MPAVLPGNSRRRGHPGRVLPLPFILLLLCFSRLFCQTGEVLASYTERVIADNGEELSMVMIALPGRTFTMGSPEAEDGRKEDEGPRHEVRLSPFYLSSTEVTLALFSAFYRETMSEEKTPSESGAGGQEVDAISGPTPIYGDLTLGKDLDHPAIGMSWINAVTFCEWLSKKTGRTYRLPTEAEWEYACRAGEGHSFAGVSVEDQLEDYAWFDDNSDGTTPAVGSKKPNAWGLYDLSGNVREWVDDLYSPQAYARNTAQAPVENPKGPPSGRVHVARGGDYSSFVDELRCASRAYQIPEWQDLDPQIPRSKWWLPFMDIIGFRVARSMEGQP